MRPLLSVVGIFCDEAANIRAVLESVKPFVDRWTILLDDKSTDGTEAIINEVMAGIPGTLFKEPWVGYAANRNRVMHIDAATTDYVEFQLMLSGDEILKDGAKLREYLETQRNTNVDCFFIKLFLDEAMNPAPRIFRTGSPWHYDDFDCGVHEVPVHTGANPPTMLVPDDCRIEHQVSDVAKRLDTIEQSHIPMLEAALVRNPDNARAYDCLTQSYESLMPYVDEVERKEFAEICTDLYHRRFQLPFSCDEEKRIFQMRYIDTVRFTDRYSNDELFALSDALYKADPKRPESALMRADFATRKTGSVSDVYKYALDAITATENSHNLGNSSPVMLSCAWKAHRIAAIAAKQLSTKHAEYIPLMREHITAGMSCGGAWAFFKDIMKDAPTTPVAP